MVTEETWVPASAGTTVKGQSIRMNTTRFRPGPDPIDLYHTGMHRPRLVTNVPALSRDPDGQCSDPSVEAPAQGRGIGRWVLDNVSWYEAADFPKPGF